MPDTHHSNFTTHLSAAFNPPRACMQDGALWALNSELRSFDARLTWESVGELARLEVRGALLFWMLSWELLADRLPDSAASADTLMISWPSTQRKVSVHLWAVEHNCCRLAPTPWCLCRHRHLEMPTADQLAAGGMHHRQGHTSISGLPWCPKDCSITLRQLPCCRVNRWS